MGEESYERLADALNALPGGYPRTESKVEIKLLKKAFTPEQVEVTSYLSRNYQTAEQVAAKAKMPVEKVKEVLYSAAQMLGLVRTRKVDGREEFRLGPFVLGWYESHMDKMDKEFAELFEEYLSKSGERIIAPQPGILGVVPVRGSVKKELLQPYDDIDGHLQKYERFMIRDCVCRRQQSLIGHECASPMKRCALIGLPPQVPLSESVISREQAIKLMDDCENMGLVHLGFYGFIMGAPTPQFVGACTCCPDCCGIMRGITEFGFAEGPQRSNYRAVFHADECVACGDCIPRCQPKAITEGADGMPVFNRDKCIGCGQCVIACPADAVEMEPVSKEEWFDMPSSFEEWEERRMRNMGWIK